jgi:hypothetical protein
MDLRNYAMMLGIGLIAIGLLGFVPVLIIDEKLLDLFATDTIYNSFYILCGIIALVASYRTSLSRWYFRLMGLLFVMVMGFSLALSGDLYVTTLNLADVSFMGLLAVIFLYLGLLHPGE